MESNYSKVPDEFPRAGMDSSISGYQPKLGMVMYDGKAYRPGNTPPERYQQWISCEAVVQRLVSKYRAELGTRFSISEKVVLEEYAYVDAKGNVAVTDEQIHWVIKRTTNILGWPLPPNTQNKPWMPKAVEVDDAVINVFIRRMDETPLTKSSLQRYIDERIKLATYRRLSRQPE